MVEVITNGVSIDLVSPKVKYTKQVNDFFDVSAVKCSYTPYLKAEKTQKNTMLFQGLGLVGDTSEFPYKKNSTQLIDNGVVLIPKGNLIVKETNEEYKIFIQDGVIDVFKLMENKSVGENLNLEELQHIKTSQSIVDSWQFGYNYRYLIADYNGRTNDGYEIDPKYQIPSVSWLYLWNKLFDFLGYTYSGDFSFISDKLITYPKPPEIEDDEIINMVKVSSNSYDGSFDEYTPSWGSFDILNNITTIAPQNWLFRINASGNYRIKMDAQGTMQYRVVMGIIATTFDSNFRIVLIKNFYEFIFFNYSEDESLNNGYFTALFEEGDILQFAILPLRGSDWSEMSFYDIFTTGAQAKLEDEDYDVLDLNLEALNVEIDSTGLESVNFGLAFSELSLKDFFKETIIRGGLTPFTDNIKRHIDFIPMNDRLDLSSSNVENWSEKYVRRTSEKYTYGSYAQRNEYKLKYNNEEDNYNDGYLLVPNENLEDVKTLFTSKFYAPDQGLQSIYYSPNDITSIPKVRMWDKEIKTDENDAQVIEYKPLIGRFYVLKAELVNDNINIGDSTSNFFYKASISGTRFNDILSSQYSILRRIFDRTKIHEIELALTSLDIAQLDFKKLKYFEDENQFYVLNRVRYESGSICKGEFIRVRNI